MSEPQDNARCGPEPKKETTACVSDDSPGFRFVCEHCGCVVTAMVVDEVLA
jgi:transcription initiation factor TFIIIB Brf1 subunit/transcription initiation factor TFIIB